LVTSLLWCMYTFSCAVGFGVQSQNVNFAAPFVAFAFPFAFLFLLSAHETWSAEKTKYAQRFHRGALMFSLFILSGVYNIDATDTVTRDLYFAQVSNYTATASQLLAFHGMYTSLWYMIVLAAVFLLSSYISERTMDGAVGGFFTALADALVLALGPWFYFLSFMLYSAQGATYNGANTNGWASMFAGGCITLVFVFVGMRSCYYRGGKLGLDMTKFLKDEESTAYGPVDGMVQKIETNIGRVFPRSHAAVERASTQGYRRDPYDDEGRN